MASESDYSRCPHGRLPGSCVYCSLRVDTISGVRIERIEVSGSDAQEVEKVARTLTADAHARRLAEQFMATIDSKIDDPGTPDPERARLRDLSTAAAQVGRDVLAEVISRVVEHKAGI